MRRFLMIAGAVMIVGYANAAEKIADRGALIGWKAVAIDGARDGCLDMTASKTDMTASERENCCAGYQDVETARFFGHPGMSHANAAEMISKHPGMIVVQMQLVV